MAMATLENVFSWSKSRDEQFRECQRKYFYDKYASWGGWDKTALPEIRLAYVLKNIKNRWAWKGETVHHVIEDALKAMHWEMSVGEYRQVWPKLANATTIWGAVTILVHDFERSASQARDIKRRVVLAEKWEAVFTPAA